ncbi:MAG TPA: hypothetical protein EYH35_02875 [Thiotrichaceae bacterium]|nr:hypothetical protein [Thiotrichaceae bacterium]
MKTISIISLVTLLSLSLASCYQLFQPKDKKQINLNFNIEAARGTEGHLSLCTDYSVKNSHYEINYDSCQVSDSLQNGYYNSSIQLTKDIHSIIGVVLFDDISIDPLYKEFNLADNKNIILIENSKKQILSWN